MAMNEPFDWRRSDRRLFAAAALLFPLIVLIGFARTYYLRSVFHGPATTTWLVTIHGLLMSLWVVFFIVQVWLIRSKNARLHMKLGWFGVALASAMIIVGFVTGVTAAKNGSPSTPPGIPPLSFFAVPFFDIFVFAALFGAAIYYRKRPANHKRLMLLTAINFLPPAVGRFPIDALQAQGPLFFFGVPTVIAIGLVIFDTWRNRKLNKAFLAGALFLIATYPLRIIISGTDAWISFANWLTGWAA